MNRRLFIPHKEVIQTMKTQLDTEKEAFFALVWLLPLVPLLAILVIYLCYGHFLWMLLLIAFLWFALWGCIYRIIQTEICFKGEEIRIRLRRKTYILSATDILHIEEYSFATKPLKAHEYKIYMKPNVNLPFEYFYIRNKMIQKNFRQLFPNVPVKKNVVLD